MLLKMRTVKSNKTDITDRNDHLHFFTFDGASISPSLETFTTANDALMLFPLQHAEM